MCLSQDPALQIWDVAVTAHLEGPVIQRTDGGQSPMPLNWVAAKERKLDYQNPETVTFTVHIYYGNLTQVP